MTTLTKANFRREESGESVQVVTDPETEGRKVTGLNLKRDGSRTAGNPPRASLVSEV